MPAAAPPAGKHEKAHGKKAGRGRLVLGAVAAVALIVYLRRRAAASPASSTVGSLAPGIDPNTGLPVGTADPGASAGAAGGMAGIWPADLTAALAPILDPFGQQLDYLQQQVNGLQAQPAAGTFADGYAAGTADAGAVYGGATPSTAGGNLGTTPERAAADPNPGAAPASTPGFDWGGQRITSAAQMRAYLQTHGYNGTLADWAALHPAAAAVLGLTPGTSRPATPTAATPAHAAPHVAAAPAAVTATRSLAPPPPPPPPPPAATSSSSVAAQQAVAEARQANARLERIGY